jgi:hypothetical protein
MPSRRCFRRLLLIFSMVLLCGRVVSAQSKSSGLPVSPTVSIPSDEELAATREQLIELLRMSPTLTEVVEVDPSVLTEQGYVSRMNPQLAQYLVQHPEVTRNPDFYLFGNIPQRPGHRVDGLRRHARGDSWNAPPSNEERRRQYVQTVVQLLVFVGVVVALLWLIRILLENRRWSRLFRLQSEVHGKLIERFASNQELLHYMETEPGKRFLEAAPIPVDFEPQQRVPGGLARVLSPLQIGIVLALLGMGLIILRHTVREFGDGLLILGMVALMPGIGFIISAIISWRISARLGLLPQPASSFTQPNGRQ